VALGLGAAEDALRPLLLDEPHPSATAREHVLDQLLEVALGGLERLLEGGGDLAVGLTDQLLQLAQRPLEVLALRLEVGDVLLRLAVLALGERVDRTELLAAADQALDRRLGALALGLLE